MRRLSDAGARLIENFEGFSARPYRDPVGVWTIGYGSTRGVGPSTPPVTRAQAHARLKREVDATYGAAINALGLPLNQNQFDALVSFVYNVGPGGVAASTTVGKHLRARRWRQAADALLAWNKAGGRVLAGLVRRRQAERALFLKPATDPLRHLTDAERRWCRELDRLRREKKSLARRRELIVLMTVQRKKVWRAAQGKGGWNAHHRRTRYRALLSRTR